MNAKAKALADKMRAWNRRPTTTYVYPELDAIAAEVEALPEWPVALAYEYSPELYRECAADLDRQGATNCGNFLRRTADHLEAQQKASEKDALRQKLAALEKQVADLRAKIEGCAGNA